MTVEEILKLIPDKELNFLSVETKVDHQVKKLTGLVVFKLILFSMLNSSKLSLRVMESFFLSAQFKTLCQVYVATFRYNSIRDRISTIRWEYFEKIFENIKLSPEQAVGLRYELANAYYEAEKFDKALTAFNIVKDLDPEFRDVNERIESLSNIEKEKDTEAEPKKKSKISYV